MIESALQSRTNSIKINSMTVLKGKFPGTEYWVEEDLEHCVPFESRFNKCTPCCISCFFLFFFFNYFIKTITWFLNICCLFHETEYLILLFCNELLFFHLNYKIVSNTINIKNLQQWCNQQSLSLHFYPIIPRKILRYIKPIFPFKSLWFL